MTGALPPWSVTTLAVIAFVAGSYSAVGAWEQAKEGKFDIDFLMHSRGAGRSVDQ